MPKIKMEKNYVMWFEHLDLSKEGANVNIGLAEDEEGFDFSYLFVPMKTEGTTVTLDFTDTNYSFIGIKQFKNPVKKRRYSLGTVRVEEPDAATRFDYMMLGRLKSDCEYLLGHGRPSKMIKRNSEDYKWSIGNKLWAGTIEGQVEEMKRLWKKRDGNQEAPEWLNFEEIGRYERRMLALVEN